MKKNWRNRKWKLDSRNLKVEPVNVYPQISNFKFQIFILIFLLLTACADKSASHEHYTYTCPMHPTVISDKPGTCPVCAMDLVKKSTPGEEVKITEDLSRLLKSPNETVVSSIRTIKGEFKSQPVSIEALGIVTYDTRYVYTIPARIGGRLEKVYLKYSFQNVRKGQKVAEIYSPELQTAQRELLYLVEHDSGNQELIESAKNKLHLLGATKAQVDAIIERKESAYVFAIYSTYDGYVIKEDQQVPAISTTAAGTSSATGSGMGDSGMGSSSTPANSASPSTASTTLIRAGNYVSAGQTLFKIVNASALRIELDVPISKSGSLKLNDKVALDLGNERIENATVDFVQPFFTAGEEFVKIRVYVRMGNDLRIGQLVKATIQLDAVEALWLPKEAVIDLGLDKVVFVKEREVFKAKKITTGVRSNGWIEIKQGISSSDVIASNAQFLVDSESFIKSED